MQRKKKSTWTIDDKKDNDNAKPSKKLREENSTLNETVCGLIQARADYQNFNRKTVIQRVTTCCTRGKIDTFALSLHLDKQPLSHLLKLRREILARAQPERSTSPT